MYHAFSKRFHKHFILLRALRKCKSTDNNKLYEYGNKIQVQLHHIAPVFDVHPTTITHFETWQKLKFYRKLEIFPKLIRISELEWFTVQLENINESAGVQLAAQFVLPILMNITAAFFFVINRCKYDFRIFFGANVFGGNG